MVKATLCHNHNWGKYFKKSLVLYIFWFTGDGCKFGKYIARKTQQLHVTHLILFQDLINRVDQKLEFGMVTT